MAMKNILSFNLIRRICTLLLFLLYTALLLRCYISQKHTVGITSFIFFIITSLVLIAIILAATYFQSTHFCHDVENIINEVLKGNTIPTHMEEDTLFSRIYHQLYQLQNILTSSNEATIESRDNLQLLISDISHQVKTPLTNLNLLLSSLKKYNLTYEEKNTFIDMMTNQLDKISSLLESMIKTSRLENGIISLHPTLCPLLPTIKKAISEVQPALIKKEISLNISFPLDPLCFHDSKWTAEAFYNILDNAIKYTSPNGAIYVKADILHSYIQISISDTGIGISTNEYTKIFQRFYRSPNVHNKAGVGLGLYLARKIITQQNGYISVQSELNKGTTFIILLPNK